MRCCSPALVRRSLAAALSVTACAAVLVAAPASADDLAATPDPGNSAVVSRLSISDGKGWLTLHTRSTTAAGYEVMVPAGDGTWGGKADVYMPDADVHCLLQAGPDLHYRCLPGDYGLPNGNFSVSIPLTRAGSVEGLTGTAWAFASTSPAYQDTFPVLDGSHYRSTAEVRAAPVTRDVVETEGRARLAVTTTIVPGNTITALDVTLPAGRWRIIGSNAVNHGVRCTLLGGDTGSSSVHCRPATAPALGMAAGRFNLVLELGVEGEPEQQYSEVSLTESDLTPEVQDTFPWVIG